MQRFLVRLAAALRPLAGCQDLIKLITAVSPVRWDLACTHPPTHPTPTSHPLQLQHKARLKGKAKKAHSLEDKLGVWP